MVQSKQIVSLCYEAVSPVHYIQSNKFNKRDTIAGCDGMHTHMPHAYIPSHIHVPSQNKPSQAWYQQLIYSIVPV